MNKSQRIKLNTGTTATDKFIKVNLEQNIDRLEFMSLNIYTKDAYQDFNSDYGVLVGRVIANGGVGIPNAKISIFIPLSDVDAENSSIASIYPYKTPRDKNTEGKRYNLLPRVSQFNAEKGDYSPKQPFGSFPTKPEIVTNQSFLDVYKKYYKFTALTNTSGDYMIFGVPIGNQTVHLSVDITDIGKYSMNPASMVQNLGYSPNLFTDDKTRIKPSSDLNDLPNIETQEIAVNIIPFWGDSENFIIGITRQDFRIRSTIVNTFTIFGSAFTDGDNLMWAADYEPNDPTIRELYRATNPCETTEGISSKRIGIISEKIFYYPNDINDVNIPNTNPNDMLQLDPSEYSIYKRDGDFVLIINCNRNKIVTDDFGNETPVAETSSEGIFTKFKGYIILEYTLDGIPMNWTASLGQNSVVRPTRYILKFPQYANRNETFEMPDIQGNDTPNTKNWKKQYYTFEAGKYYSVSKFHGLTANSNDKDSDQKWSNGFLSQTSINVGQTDPFWNVGVIATSNYGPESNNIDYQFPTNFTYGGVSWFGANWMNLSIYLPQVGFIDQGYSQLNYVRVNDNLQPQMPTESDAFLKKFNGYYVFDNTQEIAAGITNTKWFARSDLNWTDIIEVPVEDIRTMAAIKPKGFKNTDTGTYSWKGKYRNGTYVPNGWPSACPLNGGKANAVPTAAADTAIYFYKGFDVSNCIEYLVQLGLIQL
jgi:hypothetical protein